MRAGNQTAANQALELLRFSVKPWTWFCTVESSFCVRTLTLSLAHIHARLQLWGAYCKWKGIPALAHQRFWSQVHARTHARTHAHSHNSLSLSLSDTHTHAHAQAHKFNSIHTRTCTHTLAMDNLHSCKHQGVFLHPAPPNPRPLHLLLNLHLLFPTTVCVRVRLCVGVVLACVQNRKVQGAAV